MEPDVLDPSGALSQLFQALLSNKDMDGILNDVLQLSQRHIPGAQECSLTLIRGARANTVVTTGQIALGLDEVQYEQGWGPCLDAGKANELILVQNMATETRWPRYTPVAVKAGVRSSMSVPLPVESYVIGALNVYATEPNVFTDESIQIGTALAAHITAALSFAESANVHRLRAEHLRRAMESRGIIEQAKGMIMAQQRCSAETAFAMLRKLSMDQNVRLQDLATSVVASASGQPVRVSPWSD